MFTAKKIYWAGVDWPSNAKAKVNTIIDDDNETHRTMSFSQ
jgi:hypothetical protein